MTPPFLLGKIIFWSGQHCLVTSEPRKINDAYYATVSGINIILTPNSIKDALVFDDGVYRPMTMADVTG